MATIKDIAALAGVSHGTVSNVLNGRGNVSVEKITLVENAARQLGYTINAQARQLRGAQMAHHRGVDDGEQRLRDQGPQGGQRERQDHPRGDRRGRRGRVPLTLRG